MPPTHLERDVFIVRKARMDLGSVCIRTNLLLIDLEKADLYFTSALGFIVSIHTCIVASKRCILSVIVVHQEVVVEALG